MPGYDQGRPATPEEELAISQRILAAVSVLDPLGAHAKTVHQLDPMIANIDLLTFTADYSSAGVISGKTNPLTTPGGYYAELFAISAFVQKPGTNPEVLPGILFNLKNQERSGVTLWTTDLPFASFVSAADGHGKVYFPRGLYLFGKASGIECQWEADTGIYTGASAKRCGVTLHFNLWGVR